VAAQQTAEQQKRQQERATARRAYEFAQTQMSAGTVNILTVLNTENALFTAQDQLVQVIISISWRWWLVHRARGVGIKGDAQMKYLSRIRKHPWIWGPSGGVAAACVARSGTEPSRCRRAQCAGRSNVGGDRRRHGGRNSRRRADLSVGAGHGSAFYTVTVTARVDGELQKVAFTEGQTVHKGDLLAQIDPRPNQAAYASHCHQGQGCGPARERQTRPGALHDLAAAGFGEQATVDTQRALSTSSRHRSRSTRQ